MINQRHEFHRNGKNYIVRADYFRTSDSNDNGRGTFTEEKVDYTLRLVEKYWRLFLDLGFRSFGIKYGKP